MFRDTRDPQAIGEALLARRNVNSTASITELADEVLAPGTAHRLYGETEGEFRLRLSGHDPRYNGKLAA